MDSKLGINVFVSKEILANSPHCSHGPTLLFQRHGSKGRFYACAACRERRLCPFFRWEEECRNTTPGTGQPLVPAIVDTVTTADVRYGCNAPTQGETTNSQSDKIKKLSKLATAKRLYCTSCDVLVAAEHIETHLKHQMEPLSSTQLKAPTTFLTPLQNDRKEAQYLFSDRVVKFLASTLEKLEISSVICIGCPSVHEHLVGNGLPIKSLLLDLDARHEQIHSPKQFCHYNMFNHHFLGGREAETSYRQFLREAKMGKVALLVDPPFGGLVEPLALTLARIQDEWLEERSSTNTIVSPDAPTKISVMWIFPYFMERKVLEFAPHLTMLDYQVSYSNHPEYKKHDAQDSRRPSPVRIFTNVESALIPLPQDEGYKFCDVCKRHVRAENQHCAICNKCTTKHGRTYVHCEVCGRCVKAGWSHCQTCQRCQMPDHACGPPGNDACHGCGDLSHKHRDCPYLQKSGSNRKRQWCHRRGRSKRPRR